MKELVTIQATLSAPKNQFNGFGKYKYRSCEDILAALKPLLQQQKCTLTISDDIVAVGERIYIKATATLTSSTGEAVSTSAFAREEETKKGMDASQVTGAASSYARKYALGGLFAIDDTKDADALNVGDNSAPADNKAETFAAYAKPAIDQTRTREDLVKLYNDYSALHGYKPFMDAMSARRKTLGI